MVPGTSTQLLIAVFFLLPGVVFQGVQTRALGPRPEEREFARRVLRALAYSTAFAFGYLLALGDALLDGVERVSHVSGTGARPGRDDALVALLFVFVLPASLASLDSWRRRHSRFVMRTTYDPTPSAWDFAFDHRAARYVRVELSDGTWLGGYLGLHSFATGWPDPQVYLERAWDLDANGRFLQERHRVTGLLIDCTEVRRVEFLPLVVQSGSRGTPGGRS